MRLDDDADKNNGRIKWNSMWQIQRWDVKELKFSQLCNNKRNSLPGNNNQIMYAESYAVQKSVIYNQIGWIKSHQPNALKARTCVYSFETFVFLNKSNIWKVTFFHRKVSGKDLYQRLSWNEKYVEFVENVHFFF